jgi:K+-sensing histidine kinase KdpD
MFNSIDITNKIEQQQTISNQNESLRAIAQIQSHELRRPVASILGLMDFLKSQNYKFTEETIEMMETAVNELDDRIHEIVAQTVVK